MNKYSIYKSLQSLREYSILWFGGMFWIKSFFWKRNGANQPIQSEPVYFPRISHISVQFFVIFVPDIFVHSYVLRWILTTTHTFVLVSFIFLFFLSLHYVFAFCIIYTRFFFNKCLCQRSALLHLNTQHSTKSVYRYVMIIMICMYIYIYVYVFRDRLVDRLARAIHRIQWIDTASTSLYGNILSCDLEECFE